MKRKRTAIICFAVIAFEVVLLLVAYISYKPKDYKNHVVTTKKVVVNKPKHEKKDTTISQKNNNKIDKSKIDYNKKSEDLDIPFLKTDNGLVAVTAFQETPENYTSAYYNVIDKYTYACEVYKINLTVSEAINMISEVLPDDIVETERKYSKSEGILEIFYKSSLGNFAACLNYDCTGSTNGINDYNKERIVGISYLKEFQVE